MYLRPLDSLPPNLGHPVQDHMEARGGRIFETLNSKIKRINLLRGQHCLGLRRWRTSCLLPLDTSRRAASVQRSILLHRRLPPDLQELSMRHRLPHLDMAITPMAGHRRQAQLPATPTFLSSPSRRTRRLSVCSRRGTSWRKTPSYQRWRT